MMLDSLYRRGLAGGKPQIGNDTLLFRYKDEVFEFPGNMLFADYKGKPVFTFGKKCLTAKVTVLRELKKELEKKNG